MKPIRIISLITGYILLAAGSGVAAVDPNLHYVYDGSVLPSEDGWSFYLGSYEKNDWTTNGKVLSISTSAPHSNTSYNWSSGEAWAESAATDGIFHSADWHAEAKFKLDTDATIDPPVQGARRWVFSVAINPDGDDWFYGCDFRIEYGRGGIDPNTLDIHFWHSGSTAICASNDGQWHIFGIEYDFDGAYYDVRALVDGQVVSDWGAGFEVQTANWAKMDYIDFGQRAAGAASNSSGWHWDWIEFGQGPLPSVLECGKHPDYMPPAGDLNKDCYIDMTDFVWLAQNWMQCTDELPPCNYGQ